jgi:hypothetical protein
VAGVISNENVRQLESILDGTIPATDFERGWAAGVTHLCAITDYTDWDPRDPLMMAVLLAQPDKEKVLAALGLSSRLRLDAGARSPERPHALKVLGAGSTAWHATGVPHLPPVAVSGFVIPSDSDSDA